MTCVAILARAAKEIRNLTLGEAFAHKVLDWHMSKCLSGLTRALYKQELNAILKDT